MLHGTKLNLKYKIKLNDEILDPNVSKDGESPNGKLRLGKTVDETLA